MRGFQGFITFNEDFLQKKKKIIRGKLHNKKEIGLDEKEKTI